MVAEKEKCKGQEIHVGRVKSIDHCANECRQKSSMFVFGTNDYGKNVCNNQGCECFCETGAKADGTCKTVKNNGYRLYRSTDMGKYEL